MKLFIKTILAASALLLIPVFSAQAAFTNQPNITDATRVGKNPLPTLIEWELSVRATDGTVTNDKITLELTEDSAAGVSIGTIDLPADATSATVTNDLFPKLKTHARYGITVTEVRDDGEEKSDTDRFYTGPPKLKKVRVKNKVAETNGTVSATLKWRKPTSVNGENVRYVYKIARKKNKKSLIKEGSSSGDINSISLVGLPHRKMRVKVRIEDSSSTYGIGKWSAWKVFNVPKGS